MKYRKNLMILLFLILLCILAGCAPGNQRFVEESSAGFFWGVWHGWIAPISLIWSLFNTDVGLYETNNTGWWYDLGFYMAVISGFGWLSLKRKSRW